MPIGPLLPGRIPDSFSLLQTQRNVSSASRELLNLEQQLATGQRYFYSSEAPADAIKTITHQSLAERKTQAFQNTETGLSLLGTTDNALADIGTVLNSAKSISLASVGDSSTPTERAQFVTEITSLIDSAIQSANREFRGRKLFSGSQGNTTPFALQSGGVGFYGDDRGTSSFGDLGQLVSTGLVPTDAFQSGIGKTTIDLNPAVNAETKLSSLHNGAGVSGTKISVTTAGRTAEIDLAGAETIGDVALRIENEFAGDAVTVSVGVTATGLTLTPSSGTVQAANTSGHRLASDLGLTGAAAAVVTGRDLNPSLAKTTPVADLAAGAGIASIGDGLQVTVGEHTEIIDLSGATTVEDMLNAFKESGLPIDAAISDDGTGIEIKSRVAGTGFAIGENGGTLAADLGLRTFDAATKLSTLNDGLGVPTSPGSDPGTTIRDLKITRRDATEVTVDLSSATTIQDVIDAVNAVDPGVLVASFATTGNGLVLQDTSGAGSLTVTSDAVSEALGIDGSQANALATLDGTDRNVRRAEGVFGLLVQLRSAINDDNLAHVNRVSEALDDEISRFASVRGEVASKMRILSDTQIRIEDEQVRIAESLSNTFDADISETITRIATVQSTYQATLQVSGRLLSLNLLNFL